MSHQHATLGDTVYFWFASNDTSGTASDGGGTASYDVRIAGTSADAAPVDSGGATLLSNAGYPQGCWEIAVAATSANGFAAGDTFSVFATLTVDSQNPAGFVGSCILDPVPANVKEWNDTALSEGLLTSKDAGLVYESNISTVNSQTSFDCATNIVLDDNWIGLKCLIEDASTGDCSLRWITDVVASSNRIIINAAPGFTVTAATPDTIRVFAETHVQYATATLGVNTVKINAVNVVGAGVSGDLWRGA
jgi:hypothetical protein